jgi:flagella basal body P-ring formation protein FlgA
MMRLAALAFVCATGIAAPAFAQEMMALRPEATVMGEVVRLGDLVTGAGDKSALPLFRAPEIGKVGSIRAESIRAAAADLGMPGIDLNGITAVTVTRTVPVFDGNQLASVLRARLTRLDASLTDSVIEFDAIPPRLMARSAADLAVQIPSFDIETGRFRAEITDLAGEKRDIGGLVQSRVAVPVLVRSVSRGDVITAADYVLEPKARRALPAGTILDTARLSSVVAKRALKPGLIRTEDVAGRDLVERNQKVSVTYTRPGMNLTLAGKAMGAGAAGAVVQVQNLNSKRTFDAVVTGPGTVSAKIY